MTPQEFIRKWKGHALSERASAQEHFIDLCRLFEHPTPAEADKTGTDYSFEKGVTKTGGGDGFADVWKRGHFAWEYKKKKRNLDQALEQLTRYASALENPPLHVACDTERFKIVTAWTSSVVTTYELSIDDIADPEKRAILHAVFNDPAKLRPTRTRAAVTAEAAKKFIAITERLQHRNPDKEAVAHFVNQLVFCFFAEDVKLLPEGYFTRLLKSASKRPADAKAMLDSLFSAMEGGGFHGVEEIAHFNGGLFDGRRALALEEGEIGLLAALGTLDWSEIDPTIFGTLFERFLDPDKRSQIGAHYTDPEKIMMIVEPVIVRPLLDEWELTKTRIAGLLDGTIKPPKSERSSRRLKPQEAAEAERALFIDRLRHLTILDPACGSANFLYLALHAVKDIENRALLETEALGLSPQLPLVGPEILRGIEINTYAAELARTTIWIGYIQWKQKNGIYNREDPVLRRLEAIECRDALVTTITGEDGAEQQVEAEWPVAEFIVGNPPFLGVKKMNSGLGIDYANLIREIYDGRVDRFSDLVCWWFEKARTQIEDGRSRRAGLVATNSIRGGRNRVVLDKIVSQTEIFEAWSDEPWVVDGAAVRVSLICFGNGPGRTHLNGAAVDNIRSDLTSGLNIVEAKPLACNSSVAFIGVQKTGPFDIPRQTAVDMLSAPTNVNGRPNSDVVRPYINGSDIVRGWRGYWIVDFGLRSLKDAARYESPFEYAKATIKPVRERNTEPLARTNWWIFWRPRPELKSAVAGQGRFLATPRVAKHRIFEWLPTSVCLDSAAVAIARDDDASFGILHSRFHEAWSLRLGTWLGKGNDPRYTPTTTFETFPFPEGLTPNIPATKYADDSRAIRIAAAAKELDEKRRAWLNPPDLVDIVPEVVPTAAPGEAPVKYPDRIVPKSAEAAVKLKARTLTNLYNERPAWLSALHEELDRAVAAAYGWPEDISTDEALKRLLELNLARAAAEAKKD